VTTPGLRVVPDGLRALAQRCEQLAGQVAVTPPTMTAPSWQSSGAAATAVSAGAGRVGKVLASRMQATAAKLTVAANDFEAMDDGGAAALAAVGLSAPAGGFPNVDGGAGGLGLPG
jgi:hypothetical protein